MTGLGHNHSEESQSVEGPLVGILSEMVRSALEWEVDSRLESDPVPSLNQSTTGIDYPPTDSQPVPIA